jgi:hypothetical protein
MLSRCSTRTDIAGTGDCVDHKGRQETCFAAKGPWGSEHLEWNSYLSTDRFDYFIGRIQAGLY